MAVSCGRWVLDHRDTSYVYWHGQDSHNVLHRADSRDIWWRVFQSSTENLGVSLQTASMKTWDNSEPRRLLSDLHLLSLLYCVFKYIYTIFFACLLHTHRRNHTYIYYFVKTVAPQWHTAPWQTHIPAKITPNKVCGWLHFLKRHNIPSLQLQVRNHPETWAASSI